MGVCASPYRIDAVRRAREAVHQLVTLPRGDEPARVFLVEGCAADEFEATYYFLVRGTRVARPGNAELGERGLGYLHGVTTAHTGAYPRREFQRYGRARRAAD